ncbi:MAG: thioredoxin domain-containing protein [Verrucomicrobiota bacterium]
MPRRTWLFVLLFVMAAFVYDRSSNAEISAPVEVNGLNFETVVASDRGVFLVYLSQATPESEDENLQLIGDVAQDMQGRISVGMIDASAETALCEKLAIESFPSVLIFKDGVEQDRIAMPRTSDSFYNALRAQVERRLSASLVSL